mmetsp:Transcript_42313/g.117054  ORF Transcript_42313/g.117054 Transcript_42313/m.117054 type:complete len:297 (-) Transcript_42313:273-1163(-)
MRARARREEAVRRGRPSPARKPHQRARVPVHLSSPLEGRWSAHEEVGALTEQHSRSLRGEPLQMVQRRPVVACAQPGSEVGVPLTLHTISFGAVVDLLVAAASIRRDELHAGRVAPDASQVQRRGPFLRGTVDVGTQLAQRPHAVRSAFLGCIVQWRATTQTGLVDVGTRLAQSPHTVHVARLGRHAQRCGAQLIDTVDDGTHLAQDPHAVGVAIMGDNMQRAFGAVGAVGGACVAGVRVDVGARLVERPYAVGVARQRCNAQWREVPAVKVPDIGTQLAQRPHAAYMAMMSRDAQ